jgi:uncharacterized protein YecE (DUF72 family)
VEVSPELEEMAAALPEQLYMGTSSWSFPGWQGIVYAEKLSKERLSRQGLEAYSKHPLLRAASIDRTYYAPVTAQVFADYAGQVPDGFRFVVKAHELCTLPRFPRMERYREQAGSRNDLFLDPGYAADHVVQPYLEGLGDRAGVLLFQFSPREPEGGPARFIDGLHRFLDDLPDGPTCAVELRTGSLFIPPYLEALADVGAVHCFNVHPSMPPIAKQRELADGARGPATLVRWMLHSGLQYDEALERYQPFDRLVDEDGVARSEIAELCAEALATSRPVFVIANNKAEGSAPLTVFKLAERLVS